MKNTNRQGVNDTTVVITGLGVISPNAIGVSKFEKAIRDGKSGIRFYPNLKELNFRCQVGGIPPISEKEKEAFIKKFDLRGLKSSGILYGCMAATEAWKDAKLGIPSHDLNPDWNAGCIFGTGSNGIEATHYGLAYRDIYGDMTKSDPTIALQSMNSGVSSYISGILGLGNHVTTNASACNTGTEAILDAFYKIKFGRAERMLVGSSESDSPYVWGPFDSMFATAQGFNNKPTKASRPMDKDAAGFVPSSGAGALVVESLDSAIKRKAKIYAEVLGGSINSGGQRGKGTMTIGNVNGMVHCIKNGLQACKLKPSDIDLISGHLSSTIGDINEIQSWVKALKRENDNFPFINSMKSMIGHCLSASGSIESIAAILQLYHGFVHPSINADKLHPEIGKLIGRKKVPLKTIDGINLNIVAKISFGFGDVNSCLILKKWKC